MRDQGRWGVGVISQLSGLRIAAHNACMRILVVEDSEGIAAGLRTNLMQRGCAVDVLRQRGEPGMP